MYLYEDTNLFSVLNLVLLSDNSFIILSNLTITSSNNALNSKSGLVLEIKYFIFSSFAEGVAIFKFKSFIVYSKKSRLKGVFSKILRRE